MEIDDLFNKLREIKVAVIGDVMLDTYWWGNTERISPEAPVPVVAVTKKEMRMGGAANVALNTVSLGAQTQMFSVIGKDDDGAALLQLFRRNGIATDGIVTSNNRITTNKTRVISRNQHVLRLDSEEVKEIVKDDENELFEKFTSYVLREKPDVVIFEDYNKGVLTARLIEKCIGFCNAQSIVTTVDPKKKNFFSYKGVTIFKPNLKEVKEGLNLPDEEVNLNWLNKVHHQLHQQLAHQTSFITLSEKGVFYSNDEGRIIPSHVRSIADVSGAGDTVIAVASLVYAVTKNMSLAAEIANIAGGLVCEEVGTVAINKPKLLEETKALLKQLPNGK